MPDGAAATRKTREPGDRSRTLITRTAARLATVEGLDGLTLGRLSAATGLPKSSVHALFGSKEDLQLATITAARDSFVTEVVEPSFSSTEPGLQRLLALCDGYLSYVERRVFPGGCFFVAASAEVGARAGKVHDAVAGIQQQWRDLLIQQAGAAHDRGELPAGADPDQIAFELGAILAGTDIVSVLHDDAAVILRAARAVRQRLELPEPRPRTGRTGEAGRKERSG